MNNNNDLASQYLFRLHKSGEEEIGNLSATRFFLKNLNK